MKAQSNNRDPFSRIPIPKSFYHPSQQKKLSKTQKKIALSPGRDRCVSPEDEMFLKGSNVFASSTPPTRENDFGPTKFDESWPSSERPSIASTSGYDRSETVEMLSDVKQSLFTKQEDIADENIKPSSVLQRYVNRFRNSAPMSREERLKKDEGNEQDFWWLSKSPPTPNSSSTPKDENGRKSRQFIDRSESKAYQDTFKSLSSARKKRCELEDDLATQKLQEKADRILSQSESSLGSYEPGPAISSDGLTSSESQSSTSFEEPTPRSYYKDKDAPSRGKQSMFLYSQDKPSHIQDKSSFSQEDKYYNKDKPVLRNDIKRPQDDILYQWRLQRKMDLSRNGAAELISKNKNEVQSKLKEIQQRVLTADRPEQQIKSTPQFTSAPGSKIHHTEIPLDSRLNESEQLESDLPSTSLEKPVIASPNLSRKIHKTEHENLKPHLHLMCDVLPCPHAQKYQNQYKDLYVNLPKHNSFRNDDIQKTQFLDAEKPHQKSAKLKKVVAQPRSKATKDSSERIASPEIQCTSDNPSATQSKETLCESEDLEQNELEHTEKNETLSEHENQTAKKEFVPRHIPKSPKKDKVIHPKYSSSPARSTPPIKSAIGQTVKDYMFTSSSIESVSSLFCESPDRPSSSTNTGDKILRSRVEDQTSQPELCKDLDQDEEDSEYQSDGEFTDDQLLMLLRQQRSLIEKKLGEIDKRLDE